MDVTFDEGVYTGTTYHAGVAVEADAVPKTVSASARQDPVLNHVYYTVPKLTLEQVITWAYTEASGDLKDVSDNAMADLSAQVVTNNIGSHTKFNVPDNSGHTMHFF